MLLSSYGQATNDSISLLSSSPIQSDTYKRIEVGDTVNLEDWFNALGITPASYKIIDGRIGTIDGDILTATNWGKTQVTVTGVQGAWRVIALEVRPKGAVAMPMVSIDYGGSKLALKADGTVWSWNQNGFWQIGRNIGVPFIEIGTGASCNFILDITGKLYGWGYNAYGRVGVGSTETSINQPMQVGTANNVVHVCARTNVNFYINTEGRVYSWGYGSGGLLGTGSGNHSYSPQLISAVTVPIIDIRARWSAAVAVDCYGRVWQWGYYMGSTSTIAPGASSSYNGYSAKPIMVPTNYLSKIVEVDLTNDYTARLALNEDGELYRWGWSDNIAAGTSPATGMAGTPVKYSGSSGNIHISATDNTQDDNTKNTRVFASMTDDGTVYTWGYSTTGALGLGIGLSAKQTRPAAVPGSVDTVQMVGATGYGGFLTVRRNGTVWGWGWNTESQLCNGTTAHSGIPVRIGGDSEEILEAKYGTVTGGAVQINYDETNPLTSTITLAENETLQIDLSKIQCVTNGGFWLIDPPAPKPVTGKLELSSTNEAIAKITESGEIIPNKNKKYGETTIVIRETATGRIVMIRIRIKPKDAVAMPMVASGKARVVALKANGTVWGWGRNTFGDVGAGFVSQYVDEPMQVVLADGAPLDNVVQIASGAVSNLALRADGTVWSWGDNEFKQLGIGVSSTTPTPYAIQVEAVEQITSDGYTHDVIRIAAGEYTNYIILNTGEVLAWAWNGDGQTGSGNTNHFGRPRYVLENIYRFKNVLDVSAVEAAMFLRTNGTVYVAGANKNSGGIGDGTASNNAYLKPTQIVAGNSVSSSGYLENITEIAMGGQEEAGTQQSFYALNTDGEVYSWGYGGNYALGHGDTTNYPAPKKIAALDGEKIIHIAAMCDSSNNTVYSGGAAITNNGQTYTWGGTSNDYGQLGNGTFATLHTTPKLTTQRAFDLLTLTNIRNSGYVGTKQDGTVRGWGGNWNVQLGYKSKANKSEAVIVHGLYTGVQVNDAAIYRGSSAAAAYGADAGAAGTQCPGELWLRSLPRSHSERTVAGKLKQQDRNLLMRSACNIFSETLSEIYDNTAAP